MTSVSMLTSTTTLRELASTLASASVLRLNFLLVLARRLRQRSWLRRPSRRRLRHRSWLRRPSRRWLRQRSWRRRASHRRWGHRCGVFQSALGGPPAAGPAELTEILRRSKGGVGCWVALGVRFEDRHTLLGSLLCIICLKILLAD